MSFGIETKTKCYLSELIYKRSTVVVWRIGRFKVSEYLAKVINYETCELVKLQIIVSIYIFVKL